MKKMLPALGAAALFAIPGAHAQDAAAPASATPEAATDGARFSTDTPIEELVADAEAKAVLDANIPGLTEHESYDMFKSMSLKQLAPYSQGAITDELLAKLETELTEIE
ncbi:hypothetical protein [Stakelama tenebrarum]|uniref:Uncharacterized protein n=1 Tax=Stakelama tenebrarum TaxID=2711215 RepID=A0A6G6Y0T9_9SPHN|nr:hypothetical protein [Sphingosinithalassobacter tenebrarum]QIG78427.1 hypothetical protein G5C33_00540 [Sphingosinithalassobacter tenebrarum]